MGDRRSRASSEEILLVRRKMVKTVIEDSDPEEGVERGCSCASESVGEVDSERICLRDQPVDPVLI